MNVTEFNSKRTELGIEGTGIDSRTKVDINWKDGTKTPANTPVHIWFSPKQASSRMYVEIGSEVRVTRINQKYTGINKQPGIKTLEKYSWEGIAKTVVGEKVEPDGFGPTGAPSWLLVLSII
jgi:hypothetical protein